MSAGELRERVEFQARGQIDDGAGNLEGDFIKRFEVAAMIMPMRGGEQVMAARLEGRQPVTVRIRCSRATREISTDWRLRDVRRDVLYNIRSIANVDQQGKYFDLLCESGVAA